jgi:hypothetical protein
MEKMPTFVEFRSFSGYAGEDRRNGYLVETMNLREAMPSCRTNIKTNIKEKKRVCIRKRRLKTHGARMGNPWEVTVGRAPSRLRAPNSPRGSRRDSGSSF